MKKAIAFLLTLSLFACKQQNKPINPAANPIGNGNSVVFLGDYYAHYLNDLKAGYKNNDSLYSNDIKYPINRYFASCEYADLMAYKFYAPPPDTTGLSDRIAILNKNKKNIENIISAALVKCNKYLPNDSITIYIQPVEMPNKIVTRMGGVAGFTPGAKKILLTIDPTVSSWKDWLADAVTHEFNHAYWTEMNFSKNTPRTMLAYLIFEGRADSYAHFIYPSKIPAWDTALSQGQLADLWNSLKTKLDTADMTFKSKVMFGYMDGSFPLWGGYCLGYHIVQSALKNNPKLTPEQWTNMSPEKILQMSDYK